MNRLTIKIFIAIIVALGGLSFQLSAQNDRNANQALTAKQKGIITIAAYTATGELEELKSALNDGLEAQLTINEIKEVVVHLYAYCGFPRSIRGLQTLMEVLDERKAKGFTDKQGAEITPINDERDKYERGKEVLGKLIGTPQEGPPKGYGAFAPAIDTFLKEHLFADLFERDVLTYAERELVTIAVLGSLDGVEPMLGSHLNICLNLGYTPAQLHHFVHAIETIRGKDRAKKVQSVVDEVLRNKK